MRPTPTATVPPVKRKETPELMCQTREYQFITPLYGGGVDPANADPVTVVRATEIRGHLRFWWRATQGGRFDGSLKDMKKAEDDLWGAAGGDGVIQPSKVQVVITNCKEGSNDCPFEVIANKGRPKIQAREGSKAPAYAAFPLQPEQKQAVIGMETKAVVNNVEFELSIQFPEEKRHEIEAAFWAWETFGGIGARTRRGFGALKIVKVNKSPVRSLTTSSIKSELENKLLKYVVEGKWPEGVPHLVQALNFVVTTLKTEDPIAAWKFLIERLRKFRQFRKDKFGKLSDYGKSCWPEPDSIRKILQNPNSKLRNGIIKFPRAHFGLPIEFHFPQEDNKWDSTLTLAKFNGENRGRLSSPLILRPLACEGNKAVGLAAILVSNPTFPELPTLESKSEKPKIREKVESALTVNEAQFEPLEGTPQVLMKFLNKLKER